MAETRLTVYADTNKHGKWILVDNGGNTLQEGFEYDNQGAALEAARHIWPADSVWCGQPDGNGWSIVI